MTTRFDAGAQLMPPDQALALLDQRIGCIAGIEHLPLAQCLGRILAEDVVSDIQVPPHDNSAVDGWAFSRAGLPEDNVLKVVGRVAAGHPYDGVLQAGEAVRIFTGAPVPAGADTVAMQEDCTQAEDRVSVPASLKPGANRRFAGEDVQIGDVVLRAGMRLRPQDLGMAAGVGRTELALRRPLRAAVFSTGDEINEPGAPLPPGGIYDSNRTTAAALLRGLGVQVNDLGILPDDRAIIAQALAQAAQSHDLILTSGGVSVGDEDHVKAAVLTHGTLHFWRLAIKPGRPVALGEIGDAVFVGLPGNPVAVMVTFMLIARPLILKMAGMTDAAPQRLSVVSGFAFKHKPGRREWLRARLSLVDGVLTAEKFHSEGSGVLASMVWADGLAEVHEDAENVAPGDRLTYIPFAEVLR